MRAGAANGPVVATVPLDGGTEGQYFYKTVSAAITARDADAGGRPLYFVYAGNGEMNFDEFSVEGKGVAGNTSPVITSATATPADGLAPLEVDFAAEADDPDGDDITYAWDFGVEGTDDDTATTAAASWTYPEPGTYTATLTVEDETGKSTSRAVEVTVRQPCATAPTPDEGYELLFDGTDVSGWKQSGPGGFTVENCELTSFGGLGLFWFSERTFEDYTVKLQFKLSDDGDNSGVFTRFPDPGNDPFVAVDNGHEIQIKEGQPNDEPQKTGSVYNFDREDARNAKPIGEWNDYEITVEGQTYTMTLNGEVVNEYTSDGSRGTDGYIGLQNHGDADKVSFRNIQVRELEVEEPFVNTLTADPVRGGAPLEVDFTAEGIDRQDDAITYEWDFGDGSDPVTGARHGLAHLHRGRHVHRRGDARRRRGQPRPDPDDRGDHRPRRPGRHRDRDPALRRAAAGGRLRRLRDGPAGPGRDLGVGLRRRRHGRRHLHGEVADLDLHGGGRVHRDRHRDRPRRQHRHQLGAHRGARRRRVPPGGRPVGAVQQRRHLHRRQPR